MNTVNKIMSSFVNGRSLLMYFYVLLLALGIIVIYSEDIYVANEYLGMHPIEFDWNYVFVFLIWFIGFIIITPQDVRRPSDLFLVIYSFTTFFYGSVLWQVSGYLSGSDAIILLAILFAPVIGFKISRRLLPRKINLPSINTVSAGSFLWLLFFMAVICIFIGLNAGIADYGAWDIGSSNSRRMSGRVVFSDNVLAAYATTSLINGVAPFIAFCAGYSKKYSFYLLALFIAIYYFWAMALKSPILMINIAFVFGYMLRADRINKLPLYIAAASLTLVCVAIFEYFVLGYSYVSDYFFRRAVAVAVQIQGYYVSYMSSSFDVTQWLTGSGTQGTTPAFLIGEIYFGNPETNANTGTFLYSILEGGISSYIISIFFISAYFYILDLLYNGGKSPHAFGLAFIFSLLLIEQFYSIALISSGMLMLMFILVGLRILPDGSGNDRSN